MDQGVVEMTSVWGDLSPAPGGQHEPRSSRRAMGAEERRRWSSFVRQDLILSTISALRCPDTYGVVVFGPRGVGKTTLARSIELAVAETTHVIRLYGTGLETTVPYGLWGLHVARLANPVVESPISIIQGIADVVTTDADGRDVLVILDDPSNIDTLSMGVMMHLVFSGAAKLMVLTRTSNELPEDIVWLLKDGLLSETTLENFSKGELQTLITMALGGFVASSVVTALHASSGGNPLVLHTLVREEIARGHLVQQNSTWVLDRHLPAEPSTLLAELVDSRLSRESKEVRRGIDLMSLIQGAPLSLVMDLVGTATVAELEERDYLHISEEPGHHTTLAEPHIGETIRATMDREEKATLFRELTEVISLDPDRLSPQELLVFVAWAHDAGIPLQPEVALEAARVAVVYFDPLLALQCTSVIARDTPLGLRAAVLRSNAYSILADYPRALRELEDVRDLAESSPNIVERAHWVAALSGTLLWTDDGAAKVPALLAGALEHVDAAPHDPGEKARARRTLNLAMFEYQVYEGLFAEAEPGLVAGYHDQTDANYRLNCGNMLVMVWAVTGRELDAVALAREIGEEVRKDQVVLRQPDFYMHGLVLALVWTGRWRESVDILNETISSMQRSSEYRGGVVELGLGIAYTYAGKGLEAVEILSVAAAQLEIRDSYNCTQLAYSALAFAFAQIENGEEAARYLAKARQIDANAQWTNHAMSKFFTLMACRWMDDPSAPDELVNSASQDLAAGRYTMASMSLFGATMNGQERQLQRLAAVAAKRQGPMAELSVLLANACIERDAGQALEAAKIAEALDLSAVESRCAVSALDFAREAGDSRRAKDARDRIDRLLQTIPVLPMMPQTEGAKLTQRELQVAKLAGRGLGNRAIADRMGVSIRTVEGHLYQVFAKLGITSRNELV